MYSISQHKYPVCVPRYQLSEAWVLNSTYSGYTTQNMYRAPQYRIRTPSTTNSYSPSLEIRTIRASPCPLQVSRLPPSSCSFFFLLIQASMPPPNANDPQLTLFNARPRLAHMGLTISDFHFGDFSNAPASSDLSLQGAGKPVSRGLLSLLDAACCDRSSPFHPPNPVPCCFSDANRNRGHRRGSPGRTTRNTRAARQRRLLSLRENDRPLMINQPAGRPPNATHL